MKKKKNEFKTDPECSMSWKKDGRKQNETC